MRPERGRELIEQTADLLSAEYPLDVIIEGLAEALYAAFEASAVFIAFPGDDGVLRRSFFLGDGRKSRSEGTVEPGCAAEEAYRSGAAVIRRGTDQNVSVPIIYRDDVMGALSVSRAGANAFDREDARLLEAIARYLAITIRNQRTNVRVHRAPRAQVLPYIAIVIFAALLSVAIVAYASLRASRIEAMAIALQHSRADATAQQLSRYINDADQLAAVTASVVGPLRSDRQQVEMTLRRLLESVQNGAIYGIGVWYAPYTFDPSTKYYGPYVHEPRGTFHGTPVLTHEWMNAAYDFPTQSWYLRGKNAPAGVTVFTPPYFDTDYTYVSAVRRFDDARGRFAGVVTVDSVVPLMDQIVRRNSSLPDKVVYVTHAAGKPFLFPRPLGLLKYAQEHGVHAKAVIAVPSGIFTAYLASIQPGARSDIDIAIPKTDWVVHDSENRTVIVEDAARVRRQAFFLVVMVWLLAGALLLATARANRATQRSRDLEVRQSELRNEIAQRIKMEEQLRESAYRDALTNLANRAAMLDQIDGALRRLQAWREYFFAVVFIDLDRFNVVNDSLGHDAGDTLLALIARRLEDALRPDEFIARLGGDEFVVLLKSAGDIADVLDAVQRMTNALKEPFVISGQEIFVTASIGVAMGDRGYERPEEILRDADLAMYHAKRQGRAQFALFERWMHERALSQLELESDLRRAISRRELFVMYQPIFSLSDGAIAGFEALVRWQHPRRGVVLPAEFVPHAETTGLVIELDSYVMETATSAAREWVQQFPGLYLAVNASAADLSRGLLPRMVSNALASSGFPAAALKLEITETAVLESAQSGRKLLGSLPSGVRVQIDDFGTGYSSLAYLQRLPIDELKIDGSFVAEMTRNAEAAEIIRAIISLAKTLRLNVTAEGVETAQQAQLLSEWGVDFAQGYYYTPPLSADDAQAFLQSHVASASI